LVSDIEADPIPTDEAGPQNRKESTMSTTKTARASGKTRPGSKSDWVRELLAEGKTIADVTRIVPNMGYAFAYGIAKRTPHPDGGTYAERAADRRPQRAVTMTGGVVKVLIADGTFVKIDRATGKISRSKS
jgi:hypothetical protein